MDHVWIQKGHALAELGALHDAVRAYAEAARLRPERSEPFRLLGEVAKRLRAYHLAARLHLMALRRADPAADQRDLFISVSVAGEQVEHAAVSDIEGKSSLQSVVDELVRGSHTPPVEAPRLILDVSDLVYHLGHHRTLSGIQRVQASVATALDEVTGPASWTAHVYAPRRSEWVALERAELAAFLAIATGDLADAAVNRVRSALFAGLSLRPAAEQAPGSTLLNLGSSWFLDGYSEAVALLKRKRRITFWPFIHDLIPLVLPDFSDQHTRVAFARWIARLAPLADGILVNSRFTKVDLARVSAVLNAPIDLNRITVVLLNAGSGGRTSAIPRHDPRSPRFALMVSTFERRKNHHLLFDTWSKLVQEPRSLVPLLICVGRVTQESEMILADLRDRHELAGKVSVRHDVSDRMLHALYDQCLFTVYPSAYEGWGLPVTESLEHGRVPVVARNSSLTEAGENLALFFDNGSINSLMAAVTQVAFDEAWRYNREDEITRTFRSRSWTDVARQIVRVCAPYTASV